MFYLYDTTGFTLGSFGSFEDAIDEMEVLGGQEDLFISTDPNPWAR